MNTYLSFSFGCRVNQAEKETVDRDLTKAGFTRSEADPDLCLVNTCCVTAKAERESRQLIYQLRRKYPKAKIIITGCSATYWQRHRLYRNLPIDLIVENAKKDRLAKTLLKTASPHQLSRGHLQLENKLRQSGRAMVKIQDGCHRFCSYCIVPYLRGLPRSEKIKAIVKKVNFLEKPLSEVILTAINTEAFGYDTKETLINLLKAVIDKTKVPRISLGSIHPWSVNEEFFIFYREYLSQNRLVNYFHIPLQSGSDKILSLMKRGYTRTEFEDKLKRINQINPFALIATDIIVGFLGETDAEFEETYQFVKNSPISKLHIFPYSARINTAAYYLAKRYPEPDRTVKEKRAKALRELGKKKYQEFLDQNVGRVSTALFLKEKAGEYNQALLDNRVLAYIKTGKDLTGRIERIKIVGIKNGQLFGKII
jgi:threonylcarbamoyladenosine tRNA methylthiotransferase MtaB